MAVLSIASEQLELDQRAEFLGACQQLLDSRMPWLVIDMRGLRRIFSIFVGTVMDVNSRARGEGRRLTVIAREDVGKLFRAVVGPEVLEICQPDSALNGGSRRRSSRRSRRPDQDR